MPTFSSSNLTRIFSIPTRLFNGYSFPKFLVAIVVLYFVIRVFKSLMSSKI